MNDEIETARRRKLELEQALQFEIGRAVDGFRQQFGLGVIGVTVSMIEVTTIESKSPEFRVGSVSLEIEPI